MPGKCVHGLSPSVAQQYGDACLLQYIGKVRRLTSLSSTSSAVGRGGVVKGDEGGIMSFESMESSRLAA